MNHLRVLVFYKSLASCMARNVSYASVNIAAQMTRVTTRPHAMPMKSIHEQLV